MNLKEYVLYDNEINVSKIYENLSRQMKVVHNNGLVITDLNCNNIKVDSDIAFNNIDSPINYEQEKRYNLITLAKIMIGLELSKNNSFRDFSSVDDNWFLENLDDIFSVVNDENFDKDYFESLFKNGMNIYYSDYLDHKRTSEELNGKSNTQSYRKVLRTAASSLYQDASEDDINEIQEKSALISTAFNPLLIGILGVIITILITFIALIN